MFARSSLFSWLTNGADGHRSIRPEMLLLCAVFAGCLAILPYVVHTFHPAYQGLTVSRDKDYANYFSRLERALKGHPEEASNGITPIGSGVKGMQEAGMERIIGAFFGWTKLDAPPLGVIVSALVTVLLFLLFFALFRELAFPPRWALSMMLLYFVILFPSLSRVMHPSWNFVFMVGGLISFLRYWKRPTLTTLLLSILLLGVLPSLYFWSWTYAWATAGSIALLSLFSAPEHNILRRHPPFVFALGIGVLLVATPFFVQTARLFGNPLYPEVAIRASFLYRRTVESPIRTTLLLVQSVALLSLFRRYRTDRSYIACLGMLLGIVIAMHQNVIHTRVLMFASHFYPHLLLSTLVCGAWVLLQNVPKIQKAMVALIAATFLAAGAYDYLSLNSFFVPTAFDFRDQHLAGAVALLQNGKRDTILSDAITGRVITSWTDDGIVYTSHTRFLFVTDAQMAERYCVSQLPAPTVDPYKALYIEYNRVLDSPQMREREKALVDEACARVKTDPIGYMRKYGVTHVLWNRKDKPDWKVNAQAWRLAPVGQGSGWTLWTTDSTVQP